VSGLQGALQLKVTTDNAATVKTQEKSTTITIGSIHIDIVGIMLRIGNVDWLKYPKGTKLLEIDDAGGKITVSADGKIIGNKTVGP